MEGAIYEAEAANKTGDVLVLDQYSGFQGTGYVDFGGAGSFVEWDNVLADTEGQLTLTFRYAAASDRPAICWSTAKRLRKYRLLPPAAGHAGGLSIAQSGLKPDAMSYG